MRDLAHVRTRTRDAGYWRLASLIKPGTSTGTVRKSIRHSVLHYCFAAIPFLWRYSRGVFGELSLSPAHTDWEGRKHYRLPFMLRLSRLNLMLLLLSEVRSFWFVNSFKEIIQFFFNQRETYRKISSSSF